MINLRWLAVGICIAVAGCSWVIAQDESTLEKLPTLNKLDGQQDSKILVGDQMPAKKFSAEAEGEILDQARLPLDGNSDKNFPVIAEPQLGSNKKRPVSAKLVTWKSDDFQHRNLLFEEPEFERHGISQGSETRQFLLSSQRFFGKALFLPVTTLRGKPWQRQWAPGK